MTENDKQIVVECLLFAASVQVCANWDAEKQARMVEIAKEMDAQPSEDIEFWKDEYETEEPWAALIPENFEIKTTGPAVESEESDNKSMEEGGE